MVMQKCKHGVIIFRNGDAVMLWPTLATLLAAYPNGCCVQTGNAITHACYTPGRIPYWLLCSGRCWSEQRREQWRRSASVRKTHRGATGSTGHDPGEVEQIRPNAGKFLLCLQSKHCTKRKLSASNRVTTTAWNLDILNLFCAHCEKYKKYRSVF